MNQATFEAHLLRLREQQQLSPSPRFAPDAWSLQPILNDDTAQTGFDAHYIYHTAWALRRLKAINPPYHCDFGSSLYFVVMASAIVPLVFGDYRPPAFDLPDLKVVSVNLTATGLADASLPSVSCMHVVEHVGLGRYGDPIDYEGDLLAMRELKRIVAPGGSLLFVVPIGHPRIVYNAHRIYGYGQILETFTDRFDLADFALITDEGRFIPGAPSTLAESQTYGCGCFHFIARHS